MRGVDGSAPDAGPNSAGPDSGQRSVPDSGTTGTWVDETDIRPTVRAAAGLYDGYQSDGRVIGEVLAHPGPILASPTVEAPVEGASAHSHVHASRVRHQWSVGRGPGTHTITASYVGDAAHASSQADTPVSVSAALPSVTITAPANGSRYALGQQVASSFTCADPTGPGIRSCLDQHGNPSGARVDTSTTGSHAFTVTATSSDGQTASSQVSYTVAAAPRASITAPASGRTYTVRQRVLTRFSCFEGAGGPELASCDDSTGASTRTGGSGHLNTSTPGRHTYKVTATSNDGQTGSTQIRYKVRRPTPRLSALTLTPRASWPRPRPTIFTNRDAGVKIGYRDSLAARSTFTVLRCVGHHGRCSKLAPRGTFSHRDRAGIDSLRFSGRLRGHALAPGRYVLRVIATLAGQRSPAITSTFVILTPPPVCHDPDHDGDCDHPGQI